MTNVQIFFATSALLATIVSLSFTWFKWRKSELRRHEVVIWANDCISCLRTIYIISSLQNKLMPKEKIEELRLDLIFETSILIDRGRLFFRNQISSGYGLEKPSAYQGFRPQILDYLVIAHNICKYWPNDDEDQVLRRSALAKDCVKKFVSLAQREVGRDRTSSVEASKGGERVDIFYLMSRLRSEDIND